MGVTLEITGGRPLQGTAEIPAAKNGVLPLLAASLLCEEKVYFERVPLLSDVALCLRILQALGTPAVRRGGTVEIMPGGCGSVLPAEPVGKMRASVLFLAPVLVRAGRVETGMPGGCRLGPRPIDMHLDGLVRMGAAVRWEPERLVLEAPRGLHGIDYTLRFPSVGATETMLLAAVRARGVTVLRGAACEPEIRALANFLTACGARITGAGSPVVCVAGVGALGGARTVPLPDRIVASTLACAVAACGGEASLCRCDPFAFAPVLAALRQAGCETELCAPDCVRVARSGPLRGVGRIYTGVYPAFPTDAAPLLAAALLCAGSESSVEDTVFEARFSCAEGFAAMGADVRLQGRALEIRPAAALHGAEVRAADLRGGAALAIAALSAQGTSRIGDAQHILRGYENPAGMLRALGGQASQKCSSVA